MTSTTVKTEIEQIVAKLSERAKRIMNEQSVIYPEAYKRAARENPASIRRYNVLMDKQRMSWSSDDE